MHDHDVMWPRILVGDFRHVVVKMLECVCICMYVYILPLHTYYFARKKVSGYPQGMPWQEKWLVRKERNVKKGSSFTRKKERGISYQGGSSAFIFVCASCIFLCYKLC